MVGLFEGRDPHQLPVVAIGPAVIGAGESSGVPHVGPTQPVAPMAADVEKGVHLPRAVAHHQDRVLAHGGTEEVAGLGDLALVAQKQPATGEDLLQLLLVDLLLDEDAPTHEALLSIDQMFYLCPHGVPPYCCLWLAPGCGRGSESPYSALGLSSK